MYEEFIEILALKLTQREKSELKGIQFHISIKLDVSY